MHPDVAKLIVLQSQDIEVRRLREQMASLTKGLAAAEARAAAASAELARIAQEIAREEALRRKEESEIADLRVKLERNRKKLDMTTTTHQLEALEHETAFLRSEIGRIEDAELESMERGETLEAKQVTAQAAVADATAAVERERTRTAEITAADQAELAEVERRRKALRDEIAQGETGENSLSMYDRIAHAKGTAVAEALNQKCSACQMMLRPQRWNDIRDNSAGSPSAAIIFACETCGRLLFYDPARDAPQPKGVESVAASIVRSA